MTPSAEAAAPVNSHNGFPRIVSLLLNVAHGIDHMFLLIFATAVASVAAEFGYANSARCPPDASAICGAVAS